MKSLFAATIAAALLAVSAPALATSHMEAAKPSPAILAAVADPGRPEADRARDAARKPAEMLAFAGVKPGDKVADFIPGGGYFTRILSKAVGPTGKVYAAAPAGPPPPGAPPPTPVAGAPGYANVEAVTIAPNQPLVFPEPVDVLWTAQNYHDMHLAALALNVAEVNRNFFSLVKPGGVFLVIDHAAAPGAPMSTADTLHRIDPAAARAQIEAAGFVFEGESKLLRNPADAHTINVFDPAIRGKTDQFVYRFRRPA